MQFTPDALIQQLSTIIDSSFARDTIESYIEMERRFLAGDWKPTELDAGRLCEAISRALLQLDTGKVSHKYLPNAIQTILLDETEPHNFDRKDRYHIAKAIEVVYKFRSDRGPVHISPTYSANYMDSMYVVHAGKWILAELLRLALKQDVNQIAGVIEQLVQMEYSLVHELDGRPLVLATNITAGDEILLLLHHASGNRESKAKLVANAGGQKPDTIRRAITTLTANKEVRVADNGDVVLTPVGLKRVREKIISKLVSKA